MGAVYATTRDAAGNPILTTTATPITARPAMTNMAPVYTMPETPAGIRPTQIVDQVIPGVTTTLPTSTNPTVKSLASPIVIPGTSTNLSPATAAPWYQWFIDHPLYTGGIIVVGGILLYSVTKKKKRK